MSELMLVALLKLLARVEELERINLSLAAEIKELKESGDGPKKTTDK